MQELTAIFTADQNVYMQYEIWAIFSVLILSAMYGKSRKSTLLTFGGAAFFVIYLHRILLPVIVTGLYVLLLFSVVSAVIELDIRAFFKPVRYLKRQAEIYFDTGARERTLCTAVALLVILIQLARINIAIDYDSIRYGLRSDTLLTGGRGIAGFFENTGLVNNVYVYPKGFEVLTRPLYFGNTFGYVLCFNIYMLIAVMLCMGEITEKITDSDAAKPFTAACTALIPGITNMSVTAKSDLSTLLCQLLFIYCLILRIKDGEKKYSGYALACAILSYSLKPTAFVFTTILLVASAAFLLRMKIKPEFDKRGITAAVLSAVFTGIITLRTFIITGLPAAGVFTGIFESVGFRLKYPFRAQDAVYMGDTSATEVIGNYIKRLAGFLFCPAGEDMFHVRIAWGGLVFLLLLFICIIWYKTCRERISELKRMLTIKNRAGNGASECGYDLIYFLLLTEAVLFLITLFLLYQVDGNYYMLFYSVTVIAGAVQIYFLLAYDDSELSGKSGFRLSRWGTAGLCLITTVMIYFTAFTSWAGPVGFTPADILNKGYYDHTENGYSTEYQGIGSFDRIVAFADEPECYRIKGRVESWVDIDGSGGNVYLTDTKLNIFKHYCTFADIDYVYVEKAFLDNTFNERHVRAKTLFTYMLEDGDFSDIIFTDDTNTAFFAKVDKQRMSVDWETEMSEEIISRIEKQKKMLPDYD